MYGSDWGDGAVAIGDYVRQSGNHHYDGDNQRDGLTAGIRKHELVNTSGTVKLRCVLPLPGESRFLYWPSCPQAHAGNGGWYGRCRTSPPYDLESPVPK